MLSHNHSMCVSLCHTNDISKVWLVARYGFGVFVYGTLYNYILSKFVNELRVKRYRLAIKRGYTFIIFQQRTRTTYIAPSNLISFLLDSNPRSHYIQHVTLSIRHLQKEPRFFYHHTSFCLRRRCPSTVTEVAPMATRRWCLPRATLGSWEHEATSHMKRISTVVVAPSYFSMKHASSMTNTHLA